jgi:predicted transcriptional regulator/transcriptional regulator with XRE-family HTH domain
MREKKIFAGDRLKRLRERLGLKQLEVAKSIGISASYLNQIESDQRPITPALLSRLSAALNVSEVYFVDTEDVRRAGNLREALGDPVFRGKAVAPEEIQAIVRVAPEFSDRFMALYRAYTGVAEQGQEPRRNLVEPRAAKPPRFPYDEVRDWVQTQHNHFEALDRAAERLFEDGKFSSENLREDLTRYLQDRHGVTLAGHAGRLEPGNFWRLNSESRQLILNEDASFESKIFWLAHVIAQMEQKPRIEREVRRARLSTEESQGLARIALANYFAGALMMPYRQFYDDAQAVRYDVQRLQSRFGASFEQVCHRLSTMQRPELRGIPFYFAKTDIAGNILKRSSVTRFQFAQFGGPCPLWNVYRAFAHPGEILVQLATTPDRTAYLNIARTVGRGGGSYLSRPRAVAVVLGCELRYAAQTVYAAGVDLNNLEGADPIGPGCRACERTNCRHRSVPPMGHRLDVGTAERGVVPYRISPDG